MNKFKSKFNYDDKDRINNKKYSDHKPNYLSEDCDLSQKIKSLEIEGLKLRSQVESILHETNEDNSTSRTCESMNDCDTLNTNTEENALYESRFTRADASRSILKSFEAKPNDNSRDNFKGLQKELEDSKEKLDFMHQKLKEENYSHQMEKEELIASIESLKRVNFKLKSSNEGQLQEIKSRERKHETVVERLRSNLNQLLSVNKKQEAVLMESGKRLSDLESCLTSLKAFENLRDLLIDLEYHRGSEFIKDQDLESCPPNVVVDIVDKSFKEFISDIDDRSRKIRQLEDEMVQMKRNLLHDKEKSMLELRNQLAFLEEQNNYLKHHISEINDNADREMNQMRDEVQILKLKMDNEMTGATSVIDGLENNLQQLSNKLKKENESWLLEKKSLEKLYDESEKQIATIRVERDQAINQKSSVLAKLDATQSKLNETETQLLQLQSDKYSLDKQIETLNKRNKAVENSLSFTRIYLENITKSIRNSSYKGDCQDSGRNDDNTNNILLDLENPEEDNVPWRPRKYEIEEILQQIKIMDKQKKESIEKFDEIKIKFENIEKEMETTKLEKKRLEQAMKSKNLELESSKNENSHINNLMANRNGEIERLTAERDYYFQLLNEKTEDLANAKTEKHRLVVLLEERCRQLELQHGTINNVNQSNELIQSQIIDTSRGKNQILREERNRLAIQLNEVQHARDELLTNHKDQSACIEHIKKENVNLQLELKNLYRDYDEVLIENKRLLMKIKDSDCEIAGLCQELQLVKGSKSKKHSSLEKRVADLNSELSSYKNELKISQERLKSIEKSGLKSSHNTQLPLILNEMVKPAPSVDPLKLTKSRLNALEQQMNSMQRNYHEVQDENVKLTDLLRKVTHQNDRMAEELENYVEDNKYLRDKINKTYLENNEKKIRSSKCQSIDKYSTVLTNTRHGTEITNEKYNNNESINQLREDLQESIKEAKKLLESKQVSKFSEDYMNSPKSSTESTKVSISHNHLSNINRKRSLSDHRNNNNIHASSNNNSSGRSENVDSSVLNTKRSESASLTEVDRHLNLPRVKQNDDSVTREKRASSPVENLISSDCKDLSQNVYQKRSHKNAFELEEKIKRLLATEN